MHLEHRDLSYATIAQSPSGQLLIRTFENLTGRPAVLWRMRALAGKINAGQNIWDALFDTFDLTLNRIGAPLPTTGPLMVIANHPYGLVDSLSLCKLLADREQPFKVVANDIFLRAGPIADHILPISFDPGRDAARRNLETRRAALATLNEGGTVAMFPSGATASPPRPFAAPHEGPWSSFAARIALDSGAPVAPVYFPLKRRLIFDNVGFINPILRHGLQINGFYRRIGSTVDAYVGQPILLNPTTHNATTATAALRRALLTLGSDGTDPSVEGTRF